MQSKGLFSKMLAGGLLGLAMGLSAPAMAQVSDSGMPIGTTTHTLDFLGERGPSDSEAIAMAADAAFNRFRQTVPAAAEFMARSHGVLIFPRVSRAGVVLGGARGDGALVSRNQPVRFYRQQVASVGLQLGVQHYSQVYVFLQPQALAEFVANPSGWNVGADATVAVAYAAGHDGVDTTQLNRPVVVFTFDNAGLMAGITLSATQIFPKP